MPISVLFTRAHEKANNEIGVQRKEGERKMETENESVGREARSVGFGIRPRGGLRAGEAAFTLVVNDVVGRQRNVFMWFNIEYRIL